MLSDGEVGGVRRVLPRLNVPFGARCFLTGRAEIKEELFDVLMHRLALGAF